MKEKSALDLAHNEPTPSAPKEADILTSKEWKKGFLSSKSGKKEKSQQQNASPSLQPTGSDVRTTRGILKTSASGKSVSKQTSSSSSQTSSGEVSSSPPPPPPPPSQSSRTAPMTSKHQEEAAVPTPAPTAPPEPKRVSKFKAERMGGVNMIAAMNASHKSSEGAATAPKPFTGRIVERK
jgi:hypothetical protein